MLTCTVGTCTAIVILMHETPPYKENQGLDPAGAADCRLSRRKAKEKEAHRTEIYRACHKYDKPPHGRDHLLLC
jgi:hypothetical protein